MIGSTAVGDEPMEITPADDIAMIAGTGSTTGQLRGVMLSGRNLETMSTLTLMSYPFEGRPVYLARSSRSPTLPGSYVFRSWAPGAGSSLCRSRILASFSS